MTDRITAGQRFLELNGDLDNAESHEPVRLSLPVVRGMLRDLYGCAQADIREARREGFNEGMQLGARVEQRVAKQAVASALLEVLGKDAGDGEIDLGSAGKWYYAGEAGNAGRWVSGGDR